MINDSEIFGDLAVLAEQVRTQDSHITADPIFYVQQKVRQLGDENCDDTCDWYDDEWNIVDDEVAEKLNAASAEYDEETTKGFTKQYYRDVYQNVQPFFSMEGAQYYIKINGHNLKEPRVYVDSAYRNYEWQLIRALLINYTSPSQ
jgi:hypothetical protein